MADISERMKLQSAEFDAVAALAESYVALPAVVDDDYTQRRHYYENAMHALIRALQANRPNTINAAKPRVHADHYTSLHEANAARQKLWGGKSQGPLYRATELAGEIGEICNVVKKLERERLGLVGSRATKAELEDELGDGLICLSLLALEYGIDIDAVAARKFNKTSEKLGFPIKMVEP